MKKLLSFSLPFWLISLIVPAASASERNAETFLNQLPGLEETRAYEQYRARPENELSKMLYLIDRFGETNAEIIYGGKSFKTGMVARVARWFIKTHYKNDEKAVGWINQWCYRTIPHGEMIWVKDSSGSFFSARDILLADLGHLESAAAAHKQGGIPLASTLPAEAPASSTPAPAPPTIEFNLPLPQMLAVATQN